MAAWPQGGHGSAVGFGSQPGRQVHPDRHHQIKMGRRGLEVGQVTAEGLDGHVAAGGEPLCLVQADAAEVLGEHGRAKLGEVDGIAALPFRQAESPARCQLPHLLAQQVVGLIPVAKPLALKR